MIQILNWKTGEVIFKGNYPNIKEAVETAVKEGVSLAFAHLAGADLTDINLTGVNLTGVNLTGVNFAWANLTGANFRGATITRANFCNAILIWADFTGANLSDTNFAGADLAWTNLTGAIFRDSTLTGVNLYMAILTDTDITDANLKEVKFERVILTDTKPKKTIKYKTVKVIDCDDWNNLVMDTYGKPYNLQKQDGGMERQRIKITVPPIYLDDFKNDTLEESQYAMGVSFKAWLEGVPDEISDRFQRELFWGRKFYPELSMVVNDLYEKGLLDAGDYEIDIDW